MTTTTDDTGATHGHPDPGAHRSGVTRDCLVVIGAFLVSAVVVGLLWPRLVEPVMVTRTETGLSTGEVALAHRFDHDAWYFVLGGGVSLLLGVVLTLRRRTHEIATLVVVVLGALLAAAVSSFLGTATGPEAAEVVLADAEVGTTAADRVQVTADAAYLAWPLAAVTGAALVLWAPPAGRGRSGAAVGG